MNFCGEFFVQQEGLCCIISQVTNWAGTGAVLSFSFRLIALLYKLQIVSNTKYGNILGLKKKEETSLEWFSFSAFTFWCKWPNACSAHLFYMYLRTASPSQNTGLDMNNQGYLRVTCAVKYKYGKLSGYQAQAAVQSYVLQPKSKVGQNEAWRFSRSLSFTTFGPLHWTGTLSEQTPAVKVFILLFLLSMNPYAYNPRPSD